MTWLIALADTTHIVVGSVEILYLVFNGTLHWSDFIWPFALPTLAGNICGGTFIFALMSHAQIRNDMSTRRKRRRQAERAGKQEEKCRKNRHKWRGFKQSSGGVLTVQGKITRILMPHRLLS